MILPTCRLILVAALISAVTSSDPCECLTWKDLYVPLPGSTEMSWTNMPRAVCGEGLELPFARGRDGLDLKEAIFAGMWLGFTHHEFCGAFYHRMDNNYCVNVGMEEYGTGGYKGGTWCYVSKDCKELNGGQEVRDKESFYYGPQWAQGIEWLREFIDYVTPKTVIKRDVSWKLCEKDKDKRLRDMEPVEVLELAKKMDAVVGMVTKMAFQRLMPPRYAWAAVEEAVRTGNTSAMPKLLADAITAEDPIIIDVDPEGHTHQRIIKGKQVMELENKCHALGCGGQEWPFKRGRDVGEL